MTTYQYTLVLGDTECIVVREALRLLEQKCLEEIAKEPRAPYLAYMSAIPHIIERLEDSAKMTSTSSFCWPENHKPKPQPVPDNGAIFSECGNYRYKLWRIWDQSKPTVTFIGLNPSTADATHDDPTIRRCTGFAKDWGYGGFQVVNLFAYRATDFSDLDNVDDPVGPLNDRYIEDATNLKAAVIIAAWGDKGQESRRSKEVISLLGRKLDCLKINDSGAPQHPLFARGGSMPVPYEIS